MRYSASTNSFYPDKTSNPDVPKDVIYVSLEDYKALLDQLSLYKKIGSDAEGRPVIVDKWSKKELSEQEKEANAAEKEYQISQRKEELINECILLLIEEGKDSNPKLKSNYKELKDLGLFNEKILDPKRSS